MPDDERGGDRIEPTPILAALRALRDGDFSARLPEGQLGPAGEIAATFNDLAQRSERLCAELARIGREIGAEGQFGGQAQVDGADGGWKELINTTNAMAANLTNQVRCLTHVITSISMGAFHRQPFPEASREMARLFATVDTLSDNLAALAGQLPADAGRFPAAVQAWSAPDQPIRKVAGEHSTAWALNQLAETAWKRSDFPAARSFMLQSLALARELERQGNRWWVAPALEGFAGLAAAEGQPARAARLLAAAAALRAFAGRPLPIESLDQGVLPLRSALGEEAFAAIWTQGSAMSKDAAIALALEA